MKHVIDENIVDYIINNKCLTDEAYEVFKNSQSEEDKQFILDLFKKTDSTCKMDIKLRLIVIDSLYSTQAKDINSLTCSIHRESNCGDIEERFKTFFKKRTDKKIYNLIHEQHGKARAVSLITKYAYFLTNKKFPIHDSHVQKICMLLSQKIPISCESIKKHVSKTEPPKKFFEIMYEISDKIGKNGVDKFDAFCWTWGKIAIDREKASNIFGGKEVGDFLLNLEGARLVELSEEEKAWIEQKSK